MGGRCFVVTLGFHEDVVVRRLVECGCRRGDVVVVFTGPPCEGVRRAFEGLRVLGLRAGFGEPRLVHLDPLDAPGCVSRVVSCLVDAGCGERRVVAEVGAGLRGVGLCVLLGLLAGGFEFDLFVELEGFGKNMFIPGSVLRALVGGLSGFDARVLTAIASCPGCSQAEMAREAGIKPKTFANRVSVLRRMGLVEKRGRSPPRLSEWGAVVVKALRARGLGSCLEA